MFKKGKLIVCFVCLALVGITLLHKDESYLEKDLAHRRMAHHETKWIPGYEGKDIRVRKGLTGKQIQPNRAGIRLTAHLATSPDGIGKLQVLVFAKPSRCPEPYVEAQLTGDAIVSIPMQTVGVPEEPGLPHVINGFFAVPIPGMYYVEAQLVSCHGPGYKPKEDDPKDLQGCLLSESKPEDEIVPIQFTINPWDEPRPLLPLYNNHHNNKSPPLAWIVQHDVFYYENGQKETRPPFLSMSKGMQSPTTTAAAAAATTTNKKATKKRNATKNKHNKEMIKVLDPTLLSKYNYNVKWEHVDYATGKIVEKEKAPASVLLGHEGKLCFVGDPEYQYIRNHLEDYYIQNVVDDDNIMDSLYPFFPITQSNIGDMEERLGEWSCQCALVTLTMGPTTFDSSSNNNNSNNNNNEDENDEMIEKGGDAIAWSNRVFGVARQLSELVPDLPIVIPTLHHLHEKSPSSTPAKSAHKNVAFEFIADEDEEEDMEQHDEQDEEDEEEDGDRFQNHKNKLMKHKIRTLRYRKHGKANKCLGYDYKALLASYQYKRFNNALRMQQRQEMDSAPVDTENDDEEQENGEEQELPTQQIIVMDNTDVLDSIMLNNKDERTRVIMYRFLNVAMHHAHRPLSCNQDMKEKTISQAFD